MTKPTLDQLVLLMDHQIDYASLDDALLGELAVQNDEPFIATSALGELTQRSGDGARVAADRILTERTADQHQTAFALTILFERDPEATVRHMQRLVDDTAEPKVIEAMEENVANDPSRFDAAFLEKLQRCARKR